MGDSASQSADAFHLLRLQQLLLQTTVLGNIGSRPGRANNVAPIISQDDPIDREQDGGAFLAAKGHFVTQLGFIAEKSWKVFQILPIPLIRQKVGDRTSNHLFRIKAEYPVCRLVDEEHLSFGVERPDQV